MADRIAVMAEGRVQQVAGPVDLYRRPANRFVADFIGVSNLLLGRLDGQQFVSEELGALPGRATGETRGDAYLVVRPEDVEVVAAPGAAPPSNESVAGVVADVQFKGGVSQLAISVPGLSRPFLATLGGATDLTRGTDVSLRWSSAVVVPDELA